MIIGNVLHMQVVYHHLARTSPIEHRIINSVSWIIMKTKHSLSQLKPNQPKVQLKPDLRTRILSPHSLVQSQQWKH